MALTKIPPVSIQVPLVDPDTGCPTPYFQRILDVLLDEKTVTEDEVDDAITNIEDILDSIDELSLDDLDDVDTSSTAPEDGQALVYDEDVLQWVPGDVAASGSGGQPFRGALVTKAADQTAANYTTSTAVAWDSETYDTDGFHDNVTTNTRLTVPAGVTKVKLWASITLANVTTALDVQLRITKNGSAFIGRGGETTQVVGTSPLITTESSVINVSAGDYFEALLTVSTDISVDITAAGSGFALEVIEEQITTNTTAFAGALVQKTTGFTAVNYTTATALAFDNEIYDTHGFHSTSVNTTRLTVPAGVTKVRLNANVAIDNITSGVRVFLMIYKNGAENWDGSGKGSTSTTSTTSFCSCSSAVISVSAGDYFECLVGVQTDTSVDIRATTNFSIEALEQITPAVTGFQGAFAYKAADQTAANFTTSTALTWDTEQYDTSGFHDTSANTDRMTVPAGVTKVKLSACVSVSLITATDWVKVSILKNGATFIGRATQMTVADATAGQITLSTAVLNVSAGDYFEVRLQVESDTSITVVAAESWFAIEIAEYVVAPTTTFQGARLGRLAAQTGVDYTGAAIVPWTSEEYDTHGFYPAAATVTITLASPGVLTWTGHTLANAEPIVLSTTGTLPTGLTAGTIYYVVNRATNTFQLALQPGGAGINTSVSQSGVHTASAVGRLTVPTGLTGTHADVSGAIRINNTTADLYKDFSVVHYDSSGTALRSTNMSTEVGKVVVYLQATMLGVTVSPGDFFKCQFQEESDTSVDIAISQTGFSIHVY